MCLILLSFNPQADHPLILAANRDEFYDRPAGPLALWRKSPHILAGRDMRGQGTWLGITRTGRLAALTNYRDPSAFMQCAPSRGLLVKNFLEGFESPLNYLKQIREDASRHNPYNLLTGDRSGLYCYSNRSDRIQKLESGFYGLSNHLLNTPWPKVQKGLEALKVLVENKPKVSPEALFGILSDRSAPPDNLLPDTGVGLKKERMLSPIFIVSPNYGTRSSTVIILKRSAHVTVAERTFPTRLTGVGRHSTRTFRLKLIEP